MERRAFERISSNVDTRFFYGNIFYSGCVTNLSEKGMFISTDICLPSDSMFIVIIRMKNQLLKMFARVRRVKGSNGSYEGMGVELLNPSQVYRKIVDELKLVTQGA